MNSGYFDGETSVTVVSNPENEWKGMNVTHDCVERDSKDKFKIIMHISQVYRNLGTWRYDVIRESNEVVFLPYMLM